MTKKGFFLLGLVAFGFGACIKHEVIPAPEPHADLYCHFDGMIGGQHIEYTENVDGYYGFPSIATQTDITFNTDAQYFFSMISDLQPAAMRIGLGSISWNSSSGTSVPALSVFNNFFQTTTEPFYSEGAMNGFEARFFASNGEVWFTKDNSPYPDTSVVFTNIVQEADKDGDYSKFVCTFSCYLYHETVNPNPPFDTWWDSILVENAVYEGWFER